MDDLSQLVKIGTLLPAAMCLAEDYRGEYYYPDFLAIPPGDDGDMKIVMDDQAVPDGDYDVLIIWPTGVETKVGDLHYDESTPRTSIN